MEETTPFIHNTLPKPNMLKFKTMELIAQLGLFVFNLLIIVSLWSSPRIYFQWHPLINTIAIITLTEGVLILQPTTTAIEKKNGLSYHTYLQISGFIAILTAGTVAFNYKTANDKDHFATIHGKLGLITSLYLSIQLLFGVIMVFAPKVIGGVNNAKSYWKYHRLSGYIALAFLWVTAGFGVGSPYIVGIFIWKGYWLFYVAIGAVVIGVFARLRVQKLGWKDERNS